MNNLFYVARLPYRFLNYIRIRTHKRIKSIVHSVNIKNGFFKINCYAQFYCSNCSKEWTSNLVTMELWWNEGKTEFDVRIYGQKCKRCILNFISPYYIYNIYNIIHKFIEILTNNYYNQRKKNYNEKYNRVNNKHYQDKCQKCQIIHHPC